MKEKHALNYFVKKYVYNNYGARGVTSTIR